MNMRIRGHLTAWVLCVLTVVLAGVRSGQSSELDDIYTRALQEEQKKKAEQDRPRLLAAALVEDVRKYQDIVNVTKDNPATRKDAWVALCKRWGVTPIPEKPAMLAWNSERQQPTVVHKVKFDEYPAAVVPRGERIGDRSGDLFMGFRLPFKVDGKPVDAKAEDDSWVMYLPPGVHTVSYEYDMQQIQVYFRDKHRISNTYDVVRAAQFTIDVHAGVVTVRRWKITRPQSFFKSEVGAWVVEYVEE
jgi:hypothetical protein